MDWIACPERNYLRSATRRYCCTVQCACVVRWEMRAAKSNKIFDFRFEVSDGGMDGTQLNPNNHYHTISISMMIHIRARISVHIMFDMIFIAHETQRTSKWSHIIRIGSSFGGKLLLLIYEVVCNKNQILNENKCDLMCMCLAVACSM